MKMKGLSSELKFGHSRYIVHHQHGKKVYNPFVPSVPKSGTVDFTAKIAKKLRH